MKKLALFPLLLLAILVSVGCTSPKGEGFSIYLTTGDTPVSEMPALSHVELAEKPLISIDDIVSYTEVTHEIILTKACFGKVSELEVPVSGIAFIACVDRSPVYWGAFWSPFSSYMAPDLVTIMQPIPYEEHDCKIQLRYPLVQLSDVTDIRSDPLILDSLQQAGKLQ
ncbi:hypothetical protein ACFLWV_01815 [Chloroflexota bacterium]